MESVHIKDKISLQRKILDMKQDGVDFLHIVSDFDRTLTKKSGKFGSSWSIIREGNFLTEAYSKKCFEMFDYYHHIETDAELDISYKNQKMNEWWEKALELLVEQGMSKDVIKKIVDAYIKDLREQCIEVFEFLQKNDIPLLIFSGGLGDLIEGYFKKLKLLSDNVHIIANFLEYNNKGKATGFKSNIVHVFNKSEIQLMDKSYLNKIRKRRNVILLGDSVGDLGMTKGIEHDTIIRIGFLNDHVEEKLTVYEDQFDVVILNDGSMEYVLNLLKEIIG